MHTHLHLYRSVFPSSPRLKQEEAEEAVPDEGVEHIEAGVSIETET
jgi:hypothetical protein